MKKSIPVVAVAVLLLFAGMAQAEMYFEGYMGGAFPLNSGMGATTVQRPVDLGGGSTFFQWQDNSFNGGFKPAFQGGGKLGLWFERSGVLSGINFPSWMKYFGFYLDLSYHRLDVGREHMSTVFNQAIVNNLGQQVLRNRLVLLPAADNTFWTEGHAFTMAFMFAGRYGFLKDSEVPFGRLQPYIGVGPAVLFSSMNPSGGSGVFKLGSESAVNVALAVEAGLRWMALKNVSVDLSFKYRYAKPSYTFNYNDVILFPPAYATSITLSPTLHIMSFQLGAAYHF
jgi:opacity protein-like surface antigen